MVRDFFALKAALINGRTSASKPEGEIQYQTTKSKRDPEPLLPGRHLQKILCLLRATLQEFSGRNQLTTRKLSP